jgi:hypothetical protein
VSAGGWAAFGLGTLGIGALDVLVKSAASNTGAANRLGSLAGIASSFLARLIDPAVPAIGAATGTAAGASQTAATASTPTKTASLDSLVDPLFTPAAAAPASTGETFV